MCQAATSGCCKLLAAMVCDLRVLQAQAKFDLCLMIARDQHTLIQQIRSEEEESAEAWKGMARFHCLGSKCNESIFFISMHASHQYAQQFS